MAPTQPVIKDYKLLHRIGGGSFADVYEAEAPGGYRVAINEIRQSLSHEDAKRELDSLKLFAELQHDCLVRIHASWVLDDRLYVVMDLANGGTLRDRLLECRAAGAEGIPAEELVSYFRDAAEAIDYLHGEKVLHRDIKPANILLFKPQRRRGGSGTATPSLFRARAKVADFGLARLVETQQLAASGGGTSAYLAPEVWRGSTLPQSDLYSLAASYVERLSCDEREECPTGAAALWH
jgi:serine/threonine protein kinase